MERVLCSLGRPLPVCAKKRTNETERSVCEREAAQTMADFLIDTLQLTEREREGESEANKQLLSFGPRFF